MNLARLVPIIDDKERVSVGGGDRSRQSAALLNGDLELALDAFCDAVTRLRFTTRLGDRPSDSR